MAHVCKVRLMSVCFVQMRELGWELSLPLRAPPSRPLTGGQHLDSLPVPYPIDVSFKSSKILLICNVGYRFFLNIEDHLSIGK